MKVGLFAVVSGRVGGMAVMKAFAESAERVGFSTLWAPEHVVLLDSYASRYPYRDDGTLPAPTDAPIADPFLTLCTMAVGDAEDSPRHRHLPGARAQSAGAGQGGRDARLR